MSISVGVLLMAGRMILVPLQALTSKFIEAAIAPFLKAHQALEEADGLVDEAELAVEAASRASAAADEVQDAAALVLAAALAGDGFNRANPFKAFGAMAPSRLVNQGDLVEARSLTGLAAAVLAHPKAGAESKRLAVAVDRAADAMTKAALHHEECVAARVAAVKHRDQTLPGQWRKALSNVKAAVRYADLIEGTSNYASVFSGVNKALATARSKRKVIAPVVSEKVG